MVPDRPFFAVQRRYAERWAAVASVPREQAYLECTTWYHQVAGLGRDFDPSHHGWRRLLEELAASSDPDVVLEHRATAHQPPIEPGPILDYTWSAEDRTVRLNFQGGRGEQRSPLASAELPARRRELRDAVARAAAEHPDAEWMRGRSWLYDLEAYRRIFPDLFLEALAIEPPDLQFLACWGQLLDWRWHAKLDMVDRLDARIADASSTADLEAAFAHPMMETRARFATVASALGR